MIKHHHCSYFYHGREININNILSLSWCVAKTKQAEFQKEEIPYCWAFGRLLIIQMACDCKSKSVVDSLGNQPQYNQATFWRFAQHEGSHMLHCALKGTQSK